MPRGVTPPLVAYVEVECETEGNLIGIPRPGHCRPHHRVRVTILNRFTKPDYTSKVIIFFQVYYREVRYSRVNTAVVALNPTAPVFRYEERPSRGKPLASRKPRGTK
jgi:hypothetical protein